MTTSSTCSRCSSASDLSSDEESHMASTLGSTMTVKYKGRQPCSSIRIPLQQLSGGEQQQQQHVDNETDSMLHNCSILIKPSLPEVSTEKISKRKKCCRPRTACLSCVVVFSIFLLVAVSFGVMFWNSADRFWPWSTIQASGLNSTPTHGALDDGCNFRSSIGYFTNIFNLGYDASRSNPIRNRGFCKPLFEQASLRECKLTSTESCQPQVRAIVIDSINAYRQWIQTKIHIETDQESLSVADEEFARIQSDLARGTTVVMTDITCRVFEVSRDFQYALDPHLIQRWTHSDEDSLLEFMEDFGTHYVDKAVMGGQFHIKFSMNQSTAELLTKQDLSLESQAVTAALYILSRANLSIHLSASGESAALNFMKHARSDVYPSISTLDHGWMESSLKTPSIIEIELKPLEDLLQSIPTAAKMTTKFKSVRQSTCKRFEDRGFSHCSSAKERGVILPVVSINPNTLHGSSVQTSWSQCRQLCQADALCSAATLTDENNCELHRQTEFYNADVSPFATSFIPLREDLRPVTLWGFSLQNSRGELSSTHQADELSTCLHSCFEHKQCSVAIFSNHLRPEKRLCRLIGYNQLLGLQQDKQSSVTFMMSALSTCNTGDKSSCPARSECWHGLCVCKPGFRRNGQVCEPLNPDQDETKAEKKTTRKQQNKQRTTPTPPATTTTTTTVAPTTPTQVTTPPTTTTSTPKATIITTQATTPTQSTSTEKSSTSRDQPTQTSARQRIHAAWQASRLAQGYKNSSQEALTNTTPRYLMLRGR